MKIKKSLNHKNKEKIKLNKVKMTKKYHLRLYGGDMLQIYDRPF